MADLIVHDPEEAIVQRSQEEAVREGVSAEEAPRRLLRRTLLPGSEWEHMTFKEMLLNMPDVGDDLWLQLENERRASRWREVDF